MKIFLKFILVILMIFPSVLPAQEKINEDDLFSDMGLIIDTKKEPAENKLTEEKKSVGYSGEITGVGDIMTSRDKKISPDLLSSYVLGNFLLDARLKKGTKYFANLEAVNDSRSKVTSFSLRESFIDFNLKNKVYFRTGKQVLQWGRAYLWNPSDLINVEKKPFMKKIGSREGTFGIKAHAPFGTNYNIYGFVDLNNAKNPDDIGSALKYEFVLNKTEMAFSTWYKKGFEPVYAYDFSTRILGIDTVFETAVSYGDNFERLKEENGLLIKYREDRKWIPRASLDFGRQFDFMEVNDRISANLEFYYNHTGYTENILSDPMKKNFILANNLYEANNFSKYYVAFFSTFSKFIISDLILSLNLVRNLNDQSNIASAGLLYKDTINDFNLGLNFYSFLGKKDREYTFANNAFTTQLTVGILF